MVLAYSTAAAALFSLLAFDSGYRKALAREMADSGIHLFVSTEGCPMEAASLALHGGEIPKFLSDEKLPLIKNVEGVREAVGLLIFSMPAPDGKRMDLFYGIGDEMRRLKPHWKLRGHWFTDENSILLGAEAARVEKRDVGEKIYFESLDREFTVSGVLERTGSEDDGFFFLPLETAQKVFQKEGKLTGVGVALEDVERLAPVQDRLEKIPDVYVITAQQMMDQINKLIGSSKILMYAVLAIALVVSLLSVLNTILMSVFEMSREFGYMRCVGASRGDIVTIVLVETGAICLAGGVLGTLAGLAFSSAIDAIIREVLPYAPAGKMVLPDLKALTVTLTSILVAGTLAGVLPALRASGVSPKQAIRNE